LPPIIVELPTLVTLNEESNNQVALLLSIHLKHRVFPRVNYHDRQTVFPNRPATSSHLCPGAATAKQNVILQHELSQDEEEKVKQFDVLGTARELGTD